MTREKTVSNGPTRGFNPGTAFKNGKLMIFEDYSLVVMKPWPAPLAWRRTTRRPFRPHRPEVELVRGPLRRGEQAPWRVRRFDATADFMAPVPAPIREKIGRYSQRQWHMMALLARCPGADDLVDSTPALAFALASNWVFAQTPPSQPMRTARSLVRKRQVDICERLGFPARPSAVNMLRKLQTRDIAIRPLLDLRDALWDEERASLLRHAPSIGYWSLKIVSREWRRRHFSSKFLAELGALERCGDDDPDHENCTCHKLGDLEYVLQGWVLRRARGRVFDTFAQLHNFAGDRDDDMRPKCPADTVFPPPPLAGNGNIRPLLTGADLIAEAGEMQHCIMHYHDEAMAGGMALYRISAPERATFALIRDDDIWRLGQVSGVENAKVSQEVYCVIYGWLAGFPVRAMMPLHNFGVRE
jgi:hypothetical protein